MKQGQSTGIMQQRHYMIRDNALLQYQDCNQQYPSRITPLKGLFVTEPIKDPKNLYVFRIYSSSEDFQPITLCERDETKISNWIDCLMSQTDTCHLESKY